MDSTPEPISFPEYFPITISAPLLFNCSYSFYRIVAKASIATIIMLSPSAIASEERDAEVLMLQLRQAGIHPSGKTVLDVGFGYGFNAHAMGALGAKVFGAEPDLTAYQWAVREEKLAQANAHFGTLQNMPKEMAERVDLITVFKWNIARSEYADVFTALSRRISSQGKVVIGIYDELYISDPYGVAVRPHAEQYFGKVEAKRFPGTWNRYVLVCTNPNLA